MTRILWLALIVALWSGQGSVTVADDQSLLTRSNLVFRQPQAKAGTPSQWTFRSATDDSVVTLLIDAEGTHDGATPHGYAQLQVKAQDEAHDTSGKVNCEKPPCSSNFNGYLRVMSQQWNHNRWCLGTQCPGMTEVYSDGALRLTAADRKDISLKSARLAIPVGAISAICIDSAGVLSACLRSKP